MSIFTDKKQNRKPVISLFGHVGTAIIMSYPSGIIYSNQAGGYACEQPELEGILLPIGNDVTDDGKLITPEDELLKYFSGPVHKGCGAYDFDLDDANVVDTILEKYNLSKTIKVDRNKLKQSFEAWVWVQILKADDSILEGFTDYPYSGVLTWANSD